MLLVLLPSSWISQALQVCFDWHIQLHSSLLFIDNQLLLEFDSRLLFLLQRQAKRVQTSEERNHARPRRILVGTPCDLLSLLWYS